MNEEVKQKGAEHYKTGGVEPLDLMEAGGILQPFAVGCIIKYAFRNRRGKVRPGDMDKIIHYAEILKELAKPHPRCTGIHTGMSEDLGSTKAVKRDTDIAVECFITGYEIDFTQGREANEDKQATNK